MKAALIVCLLAATFLLGSIAVRFLLPARLSPSDPAVRALEERYRSLAGFSGALGEMEAKAKRVRAAVWTPQALAAFVAGLPPGWIARPIATDHRQGITLHRYAFSKEAALRDYPDFQRVLKKIEEHAGTRIDTLTLTLNADGRRFATALITATIPVSPTKQP
jgi:hypothetical protein